MCSTMDDTSDRKEKVTSTRRNNKPLMEKRRRARINDCLVQLKSLVLQAMNKDTTQYSKLEKADILEMTVKHLKLVQRQQVTSAMATDPNVISKYRAGFNECASEIARYLDTVNGGNPELKGRVLNYLGSSMMQFPVIPVYQGVVSPYQIQMTSPTTSQRGFGVSPYPHGSVPVVSNNNGFGSTFQHPHQQQQKHNRDFLCYAHHSSEDLIKREPSPISVNIDTTSHVTSQPTSPIRRIPSPCDSDSGLSDSSTSFSHDENGNYSQFNISQDLSIEHESRFSAIESRLDANYSLSDTRIHNSKTSPKRKSDVCSESVHKRRRVNETAEEERDRGAIENDPMWRPW